MGTGKPTGRPKKVIDQKTFEQLCGIQCTEQEISAFFDVSDRTLEKWCKDTYGTTFFDIFQQKRGLGKISLRRTQWKLAEKSNAMAIWLGKQYLDQREPGVKVDINADDDQVRQFLDALKGGDSD